MQLSTVWIFALQVLAISQGAVAIADQCTKDNNTTYFDELRGYFNLTEGHSGLTYCYWVLRPETGRYKLNMTATYNGDVEIKSQVYDRNNRKGGTACLDEYEYDGTKYFGTCVPKSWALDWCKTADSWVHCDPLNSDAPKNSMDANTSYCYHNCREDIWDNSVDVGGEDISAVIEYTRLSDNDAFRLEYLFTPCENAETETDVTTMTTVTNFLSAGGTTEVMLATRPSETLNESAGPDATDAGTSDSKMIVYYVSAGVGALIFLLLIALVLILVMRRKIQRRRSDKRVLYSSAADGDVAIEQGDHGTRQTVDNVLYGTSVAPSERETVDNVLYGTTN